MKHELRLIALFFIIVFLYYIGFKPELQVVLVMFFVSGVFFSLGYFATIAMDFDKITNKRYLEKVRQPVSVVQEHFILYFLASALIVAITGSGLFRDETAPAFAFTLYVMVYMIYNFVKIKKFKDDLVEELRKNGQ